MCSSIVYEATPICLETACVSSVLTFYGFHLAKQEHDHSA